MTYQPWRRHQWVHVPPKIHLVDAHSSSGILCDTKVTRRTKTTYDPSVVDCKLCKRIMLGGVKIKPPKVVLSREEYEEEENLNNYLKRLGVKWSV